MSHELNELKVQELIAAKQVKKQKGATMIEYAIVVAAVAAIAVLVFGTGEDGVFKNAVESAVQKSADKINEL